MPSLPSTQPLALHRQIPRYRFHLAVALDAANDSSQAKSELKAALDNKLTSQILTKVDQADLAALRQKYEL